ncbi:hypothetical protein KEM48_009137 [Puccinia striiformis f. sp. tritici PST-130]|nr:hypothetical protein KEM48_009137 [Puccinia striiformis f. sp. tritici PST-130]
MWQGSCTPLSIPTKNDYELCIRRLIPILNQSGSRTVTIQNNSNVSGDQLAKQMPYHVIHSTLPTDLWSRSQAPSHTNLPTNHPEFIFGLSQVFFTRAAAIEINNTLYTLDRPTL